MTPTPTTSLLETNRAAAILRGRDQVLRELASGTSIDGVLDRLANFVEEVVPETRVSILRLANGRLWNAASPSLPLSYLRAIEGVEIGERVGSCGAAAFLGERVVVEDVLSHPNWTGFRAVARAAGIRASWSEPILSREAGVLGTFAMYYAEPRRPDAFEQDFIHSTAQVAGVAIDVKRVQSSLRESEERFRQLAENIQEVFWLTDWDANRVLYVSPAYEEVWGRPCQQLYDEPGSWSRTIHPDDRERVHESFVAHAASGTYDVEYRLVHPDGGIRWIHDRAFPIRDESGRVYRVCGISADITARRADEARRRAADRRALESLTAELLLAEERERKNLAQDLHDGPNQTLTLAQMKLEDLARRSPDELQPELARVIELLGQANQQARTLTFQLSPPVLHDFGFEPAVQWLVEDVASSYGIEVTLVEDEEQKPLDERVRVLLYRAVRELLINVGKHAQAASAHVELRRDGDFLVVRVSDDGASCDRSLLESGRGLGLRTIRERLSHLGGRMEIRSEPGSGTSVTLFSPLLEESE